MHKRQRLAGIRNQVSDEEAHHHNNNAQLYHQYSVDDLGIEKQLTDQNGKPLKGILKNNQFQSLPRPSGSCGLCYYGPIIDLHKHPGLLHSALLLCDPANETLNKNEVLEKVESSV